MHPIFFCRYAVVFLASALWLFVMPACKQKPTMDGSSQTQLAKNLTGSCRIDSISELLNDKGSHSIDYTLNCSDGREYAVTTRQAANNLKPGDQLPCAIKSFAMHSIWNCGEQGLEFVSNEGLSATLTAVATSQLVTDSQKNAGTNIPAPLASQSTDTATSVGFTAATSTSSSVATSATTATTTDTAQLIR